MNLFLFGTLRHLPLLEAVSGDATIGARAERALLPGHRVARVAGQVFPMLTESDGVAEGLLLRDLTGPVLSRLDYYEAAFGYDRHEVALRSDAGDVAATVYLPRPGLWEPAEDWSLEGWAAEWGALTVETAEEAMWLHGQGVPPEVMGARYTQIMSRAAARLRAGASGPVGGYGRGDVVLHRMRRPYMNFFAAEEMDLSFRKFDGGVSDPVERAVWSVGDSTLVLPYDPTRDRVLLIEQFRPGPYRRGDPSPWLMEPIAGRIDGGERPEDAARREAREEAGLQLGELHLVSSGYPSPGTTTEHFHIYVGIADLPDDITGIGGAASEAEDIKSHLLDWADFDAKLIACHYRLVPLELAGHWLARNRDRLRASA